MFLNLLAGGTTLAAQVAAIFRKYGTDAHVYLPGIGVINGLTAGNYLDSAGTTAATVDNPVGLVVDSGGINAIQATTANKPILRRGAVNLLTYSEQFDNAAWAKAGVAVTQNAITAPNGALTADLITENAATSVHILEQTISPVINVEYTYSLYLKKGTNNFAYLTFTNNGVVNNWFSVVFDLNSGVATQTANGISGVLTTSSITSIGDGWFRCVITGKTTGAAANRAFIGIAPSASGNTFNNVGAISYAGAGTRNIYAWGAQLQVGTSPTDYVATITAAASSPTGNYHWMFDSTDVLTATFPAGYESATIINTAETGQVTYTAQNVVGSYDIRGASIGAEKINDPSFNTPSDWNPQTADWVVSGGKATYTDPGSGVQWLEPITAVPLTAGKTYRLSLVISGIGASQNAVFGFFNQASSANLLGAYQTIAANGRYEYIFTAASSTPNIKFYGNSSGTTASWSLDQVSITEATSKEYARFIFRTGLTASELSTMQTFANRLAGV